MEFDVTVRALQSVRNRNVQSRCVEMCAHRASTAYKKMAINGYRLLPHTEKVQSFYKTKITRYLSNTYCQPKLGGKGK